MAKKTKTSTSWSCDGQCGLVAISGNGEEGSPDGWTIKSVPVNANFTQGIFLCPKCAADLDRATARYIQSLNR